jgi:hypothetical protein
LRLLLCSLLKCLSLDKLRDVVIILCSFLRLSRLSGPEEEEEAKVCQEAEANNQSEVCKTM